MIRKFLVLSALASWAIPAMAQDDDDVERVTGKAPPPLEEIDIVVSGPKILDGKYSITNRDELLNAEFDMVDYRGANEIGLEPAFIHRVREGLKFIYLRDYKGATNHFAAFERDYPDSAIAAAVQTMVWQARMLENFDFQYEAQYWVASAKARRDLEHALSVEGNEAWEHFLRAGVVGIESIHLMRTAHYLKALQLAFEAVDEAEQVRELAPDFTDLALADGMYNYWRTVVTQNSKVLPDFGDNRAEGIAQMRSVETGGIFLGPPTTLALAFTWIEEGDMKAAINSCLKNKRRYPDNIINNLVTGTTYVYMRKYRQAQETFDAILEIDPNNRRVFYWRGVAKMRRGRYEGALSDLNHYIAFDYMEDYQRSQAYYRLGQTHYRQNEFAEAEQAYKDAVKVDGHKSAKGSLERIKKAKKEGKLDY
jgi:tetratricopeptide (TPR) repeat protein